MPQQDRSPAFQFYSKDFLSDPNVMMMSNAQRGAYITLICVCWQQDGLPKEEKFLARLVGESDDWWSEHGALIRSCFKVKGKRLIHPRLESEIRKQKNRRTASQKANKKRWGKSDSNQQHSIRSDDVTSTIGEQSESTPSPSPSPTTLEHTHTTDDSTETAQAEHAEQEYWDSIEPPHFIDGDFEPNPIQQKSIQGRRPRKDVTDELIKFKCHRFKNPVGDDHQQQGLWVKWWMEEFSQPKPANSKPADALEKWAEGDNA